MDFGTNAIVEVEPFGSDRARVSVYAIVLQSIDERMKEFERFRREVERLYARLGYPVRKPSSRRRSGQ